MNYDKDLKRNRKSIMAMQDSRTRGAFLAAEKKIQFWIARRVPVATLPAFLAPLGPLRPARGRRRNKANYAAPGECGRKINFFSAEIGLPRRHCRRRRGKSAVPVPGNESAELSFPISLSSSRIAFFDGEKFRIQLFRSLFFNAPRDKAKPGRSGNIAFFPPREGLLTSRKFFFRFPLSRRCFASRCRVSGRFP